MDTAGEQLFRAFVEARSAVLLRTAYLLVGDRGRAEDLLQTALVKTFVAWPRVRDVSALEGYVRRTMATTATSWWRGRPYRERPVAVTPDRVAADELGARMERDVVWPLVRDLPTRQRAVLVLRYYEGLSEAEIADLLGVSRGTVKSHAARALAMLRKRIAADDAELGVAP